MDDPKLGERPEPPELDEPARFPDIEQDAFRAELLELADDAERILYLTDSVPGMPDEARRLARKLSGQLHIRARVPAQIDQAARADAAYLVRLESEKLEASP